MKRRDENLVILWIVVFCAGLIVLWCGCTVAITFGSGKASTDSHDQDDHGARATNSRTWDVDISPR